MHKAGLSSDKIIALIRKTNSQFTLSTYQIDRLQRAGVPDEVINYMIRS